MIEQIINWWNGIDYADRFLIIYSSGVFFMIIVLYSPYLIKFFKEKLSLKNLKKD